MSRILILLVALGAGTPGALAQSFDPSLGALPDAPSATRVQGTVARDAAFAPLTPRDKFVVATLRTRRGSIFLLSGLQAGFSQAIDRPEGFGHGADGYGRRYGAALADNLSFDFFGRFAFPVLFHQDPRYFRAGSGPAGSRLKYAVSRILVTRTDSGGRTFNSSQVMGSLFSSALANAYYPEEDRDAGGTFSRAGSRLAWAAAGNILREYWPDIRRKIRPRNQPTTPSQSPPDSSVTH